MIISEDTPCLIQTYWYTKDSKESSIASVDTPCLNPFNEHVIDDVSDDDFRNADGHNKPKCLKYTSPGTVEYDD